VAGVPRPHVDITENAAYVVNPATYAYEDHGKGVTMAGCTWTVVLKKSALAYRRLGLRRPLVLGKHLVERAHSGSHVIGDMAVE
jgi:hypothetical protein